MKKNIRGRQSRSKILFITHDLPQCRISLFVLTSFFNWVAINSQAWMSAYGSPQNQSLLSISHFSLKRNMLQHWVTLLLKTIKRSGMNTKDWVSLWLCHRLKHWDDKWSPYEKVYEPENTLDWLSEKFTELLLKCN